MNIRLLGIVLVVLGLIGVVYGGISWTYEKKDVDLGPIQISHDKTKSIPIPPIAGAISLLAGALLIATDRKHA